MKRLLEWGVGTLWVVGRAERKRIEVYVRWSRKLFICEIHWYFLYFSQGQGCCDTQCTPATA